MPSKRPVVTMLLDEDLLHRLDDYRFENRFPNRSAAIKHLLEYALAKSPKPPKAPPKE